MVTAAAHVAVGPNTANGTHAVVANRTGGLVLEPHPGRVDAETTVSTQPEADVGHPGATYEIRTSSPIRHHQALNVPRWTIHRRY